MCPQLFVSCTHIRKFYTMSAFLLRQLLTNTLMFETFEQAKSLSKICVQSTQHFCTELSRAFAPKAKAQTSTTTIFQHTCGISLSKSLASDEVNS